MIQTYTLTFLLKREEEKNKIKIKNKKLEPYKVGS
jgi:hypothetical protein